MFSIGNDELGNVLIKKGDKIRCLTTGEKAIIQFGKDAKTNKETNTLCFVTLKDNKSYLVGIAGKLLTDRWELINE